METLKTLIITKESTHKSWPFLFGKNCFDEELKLELVLNGQPNNLFLSSFLYKRFLSSMEEGDCILLLHILAIQQQIMYVA